VRAAELCGFTRSNPDPVFNRVYPKLSLLDLRLNITHFPKRFTSSWPTCCSRAFVKFDRPDSVCATDISPSQCQARKVALEAQKKHRRKRHLDLDTTDLLDSDSSRRTRVFILKMTPAAHLTAQASGAGTARPNLHPPAKPLGKKKTPRQAHIHAATADTITTTTTNKQPRAPLPRQTSHQLHNPTTPTRPSGNPSSTH